MFNCQLCGKSIGPKVAVHKVVTETRPVAYHNVFYREDEWGNEQRQEVNSRGTEIVRELTTCGPCQGEDETPKQPTTIVMGGKLYQEKQAEPFKQTLISVAIQNMLSRLDHKSKRAQRDTETVVPQIKAYVDEHKEFVFA